MIYTSRYQNPELATGRYTVVGVTRGKPKFPLEIPACGEHHGDCPTPDTCSTNTTGPGLPPDTFQHMDRQGARKIAHILAQYERLGKDVVLCCFEDVRKPNEWCHRLVFAEWWSLRTGENIPELPDPSPVPGAVKPPAPAETPIDQLKMW